MGWDSGYDRIKREPEPVLCSYRALPVFVRYISWEKSIYDLADGYRMLTNIILWIYDPHLRQDFFLSFLFSCGI